MSSEDCPVLQLHADDNVAVARRTVSQGTEIRLAAGNTAFSTADRIDIGHKVAVSRIESGEAVRKFGQCIGFATRPIEPGGWVHSHNLQVGSLELDYAFATEVPPAPTPIEGRTFPGYRRTDGKVGTRNYIGVISTVNCSATTAKLIAQSFDSERLHDFPNVDGVVPLVHSTGCGMAALSEDHAQLNRTLAGFARNPNIAAYLVVGLGCEIAQASLLADDFGLVQLDTPGHSDAPLPIVMNIQEEGGVAKTVERGVQVLNELLPQVNQFTRESVPVSELILASECGGSDGNSGVTANPALGFASDLLVSHGGTAILGETSEVYGGEHLLTRRAVTREVGKKLIERIQWWEEYTGKFGVVLDNNPSPGNKAGGLTTIYEKSLGAIAKGGTTALRAVYKYAEPVTEKGFVFMDTPGYDAPSVTGMIAGGANMVVFTTGRGSCFACQPVPTIKVATNTPMYEQMSDDMDVNAGRILDGTPVEEVGREIFELILSVAGGAPSKSESQGLGTDEFVPWKIGPTL